MRDKALNIAKNLNYDGDQRGLASMVYKFFDKKCKGSGRPLSSASRIANDKSKQNMQLAKELHNQLLETLKKEQFIQDVKIIFWVLI